MNLHPNYEEYDPLMDRDFTVKPYKFKHYYLYKITNLLDGWIYIGKSSTVNFPHSYMGSSKHLDFDMEKHGKENFKKEIFAHFDSDEKAYWWEGFIVNPEFVARKNTYNRVVGGKRTKVKKYRKGEIIKCPYCHISGVNNGAMTLHHFENCKYNPANVGKKRTLHKTNSSGFTGVERTPNGNWRAKKKIDGKTIHLGTFPTGQLASDARVEYEKKQYDEYIRLNNFA